MNLVNNRNPDHGNGHPPPPPPPTTRSLNSFVTMLWQYVEMRVCKQAVCGLFLFFDHILSPIRTSHSSVANQHMHLGRIGLPNPINLIHLPSELFYIFCGEFYTPTLSFVVSKPEKFFRSCFLTFIKKITYLITIRKT